VCESGAGWVVDSSDPAALPRAVADVFAAREEILRRGAAARAFAEEHFTQDGFARRFEATLGDVVRRRAVTRRS
jgi:glycosyltransferase involved in cell wall biosynthesis